MLIGYTATRDALCRADGDIFVLHDGMVMTQERRPAGLMPLGTSSGVVRVPTNDLLSGSYVVRFFIHNDCGDRLHTIEVPDIPFRIE